MPGNRVRSMAACATGALVLAVLAGAVLHWQLASGRRAALATVEAEIRRAAEANAVAERAARDLPRLRAAVKQLAKRVPPDANLSGLLGAVGTDAGPPGLPEREIVSKPTIPGQPVARVPFALQYRGSFESAVTLLRRLEDGPLLTRVERVSVESESPTGGEKPLRVQVEFSTFARTSKELEAWSQAE